MWREINILGEEGKKYKLGGRVKYKRRGGRRRKGSFDSLNGFDLMPQNESQHFAHGYKTITSDVEATSVIIGSNVTTGPKCNSSWLQVWAQHVNP